MLFAQEERRAWISFARERWILRCSISALVRGITAEALFFAADGSLGARDARLDSAIIRANGDVRRNRRRSESKKCFIFVIALCQLRRGKRKKEWITEKNILVYSTDRKERKTENKGDLRRIY